MHRSNHSSIMDETEDGFVMLNSEENDSFVTASDKSLNLSVSTAKSHVSNVWSSASDNSSFTKISNPTNNSTFSSCSISSVSSASNHLSPIRLDFENTSHIIDSAIVDDSDNESVVTAILPDDSDNESVVTAIPPDEYQIKVDASTDGLSDVNLEEDHRQIRAVLLKSKSDIEGKAPEFQPDFEELSRSEDDCKPIHKAPEFQPDFKELSRSEDDCKPIHKAPEFQPDFEELSKSEDDCKPIHKAPDFEELAKRFPEFQMPINTTYSFAHLPVYTPGEDSVHTTESTDETSESTEETSGYSDSSECSEETTETSTYDTTDDSTITSTTEETSGSEDESDSDKEEEKPGTLLKIVNNIKNSIKAQKEKYYITKSG